MQVVIRQYRPSDKDTVLSLFSIGILEHIGPCFNNAMTSPLYLAITLTLCVAGYMVSSLLGAVVLAGAWIGLVYYCCHELYSSFVREKLRTDMQDIPGNYLRTPDDGFWVAEAEVDGRAQIMGMVAVVAKRRGKERYGELFRMIISPSCRRVGLGSKLAQTVVDFCKERGFSKVVLETSSTQTAAVGLYRKLGFSQVLSHTDTQAPAWIITLAKLHLVMKLVIRQYHPSDNNEVLTLVSCGVLEHISPCFYSAITCPLYVTITLTLCAAGYLLSSMLGAVVLPGAWVGLVYYCCHETSASSARLRLKEIRDIPGSYLGKPDDCFWVAEAEVEARAQIVGVVAVEGKHSGKERYGELCKLTVSPSYRRVGLGSRLVQTVVNFCKERGFSKVELNTSSTRTASLALYKKLGFSVVLLYTKKTCPIWVVKLARVKSILMEKQL